MNDQVIILFLLAAALVLFLSGRWRHDVVALVVLVAAVFVGVVPTDMAFSGFGHPAVVTVGAVLVISRALQVSGVLNVPAVQIAKIRKRPALTVVVLTCLAAGISGFMNNVGALALLMPLALRIHPSPSRILMPLAFGTLLGGMMTEIGTPPNIIIATYREEMTGTGFALFDFAPVGIAVTIIGVAFITTFGLKLLPERRRTWDNQLKFIRGVDYITEAGIPADSKAVGKTPRQLERMVDNEALVIGVIRGERRLLGHLRNTVLRQDDVVILRSDSSALSALVDKSGIALIGNVDIGPDVLRSEEITLLEAVVMPGARLINYTARTFRLHRRYGINLLAIARRGERINNRLGHVPFKAGDVLLVQGEHETLAEAMSAFGCIPLAGRSLRSPNRGPRFLTPIIFGAAILATAFQVAPIEISFVAAVAALFLTRAITPREAYESIDWSVIVLLGALIPLGHAVEISGGAATIAEWISGLSAQWPYWSILAVVMIVTMALTNLINNAATAVLMAPVAAGIAHEINASLDPFLMAVAIGASAAFLTPIGHQSNVLIMGPGGYRFGDYWRLGLPLQTLILLLAVPLILLVWPV